MFGNDTLRASIPERGAIECLRHLNGRTGVGEFAKNYRHLRAKLEQELWQQ